MCDSSELEAEPQYLARMRLVSIMRDSPELVAEHQHLARYEAGISHV